MAALATWAEKQSSPIAAVNIWGNGVNPVHGQGINDRSQVPESAPSNGYVPENVVGDIPSGALGYTEEDRDATFAYGFESGLADHPNIGDSAGRGAMPIDYPEPGYHVAGLPGGTKLRSEDHGAKRTWWQRALYSRPVVQGLVNKNHRDTPNDSVTADMSQLMIGTGEVQGIRSRSGSQRSGSQSEFRGTIHSRVRGMKIQEYAGGERHDDMRPRQQSPGRHRGFSTREAGTGNPAEMRVNAAYTSIPRLRTPPAAPDTGLATPTETTAGYAGFTEEDPTWT